MVFICDKGGGDKCYDCEHCRWDQDSNSLACWFLEDNKKTHETTPNAQKNKEQKY